MLNKDVLKGEITCAQTFNSKLIIGTSAGEVVLLDLSEASSAGVISALSNIGEEEGHNQTPMASKVDI